LVPTSLHLLLLLLTLLSMRYWFMLFQDRNSAAVFQFNTDRSQLETSLPVFLTILWISHQLMTSMTKEWMQWQQTTAPADTISLNTVIASCVITVSFGVVLILFLVILKQDSLQKLGFRLNDIAGQLRDGSVGFLLALLPVMALLLLTQSFRTEEAMHPLFLLLKARPQFSTISWIFISAVVVAPLFEELIYRVLFQSWLEDLLPPLAAILTSSLIFSIVHGFPDCIPLFPLALILGALFYYRRSYAANVVTHALFNGINLALALANQPNPV
jgi:uncharacterized protein